MSELLGRATLGVVVLGFAGLAVGFAFRRREARGAVAARDWPSLLGILLQMAGYGVAWSLQRQQPWTRNVLGQGIAVQAAWLVVAAVLSAWSAWAVIGAVRALGRQWSLQARVLEDHELITRGPFRVVRHPIYSAMLALLLASGIAFAEWRGVVAGLAVSALGTWLRVRGEDRLLRAAFGRTWEEWAARVPARVPRPARRRS